VPQLSMGRPNPIAPTDAWKIVTIGLVISAVSFALLMVLGVACLIRA
jgi:hypothetical protein